ncbi:MAG: hypothetical protein HZB42_10250 [Sphingobacteriales bacterium]|nr:hypothetical protein [Sphingobacteriales bacterium]
MKKFFPFFVLLCPFFISAQTETDIRNHYTEVNKQIAESIEHGFEGSLYNNHWETNKNGKSWPAVGNYSEITDFWYDDDPNHLPVTERNPKNVLSKVNMTRKAAGFQLSEEYLFKDGKLLFYYSLQAEEGSMVETRLYFKNNGAMFKSSVKANELELTPKDFLAPDYKEFKPNPGVILSEAKAFQDLFVKSM